MRVKWRLDHISTIHLWSHATQEDNMSQSPFQMCVCTPKWFITKQVDLGMSHKPGDPIWPHLVLANHHMSLHGPHTDPPTAEGISSGKVRNVAVVNWQCHLAQNVKWIVNGHLNETSSRLTRNSSQKTHEHSIQRLFGNVLKDLPRSLCFVVLHRVFCNYKLDVESHQPWQPAGSWGMMCGMDPILSYISYIILGQKEEHHKRIDCEFHVGHVQLDQIG